MTDGELEAIGFEPMMKVHDLKDRLKAGLEGVELLLESIRCNKVGSVHWVQVTSPTDVYEAIQNLKTFFGIETINKGKEK